MGFPESIKSNDSVELCIFKVFFSYGSISSTCVQKWDYDLIAECKKDLAFYVNKCIWLTSKLLVLFENDLLFS